MLVKKQDTQSKNWPQTVEKNGPQALLNANIWEIPEEHPAAVINTIYCRLLETLPPQHLPSLEVLRMLLGAGLMEYCLILTPVYREPFVDFLVEHCGIRIPGTAMNSYAIGGYYTDKIFPHLASERLMELTSCLSLKRCRFSRTYSARPSSLNVKVFRAVFPVWSETLATHGVVLTVAPIHIMAHHPR